MGLDVYLQFANNRRDNHKKLRQFEKCAVAIREAVSKELLGYKADDGFWGRFYKEPKVVQKRYHAEVARRESVVAKALGLREKVSKSGWRTLHIGDLPRKDGYTVELPSKKFPEHVFKIGYFRSSYNDGGLDRLLDEYVGSSLGTIMGYQGNYEFRPNWKVAKERAREARVAFEAAVTERPYRASFFHVATPPPWALNVLPLNSEQAKTAMLKAHGAAAMSGVDCMTLPVISSAYQERFTNCVDKTSLLTTHTEAMKARMEGNLVKQNLLLKNNDPLLLEVQLRSIISGFTVVQKSDAAAYGIPDILAASMEAMQHEMIDTYEKQRSEAASKPQVESEFLRSAELPELSKEFLAAAVTALLIPTFYVFYDNPEAPNGVQITPDPSTPPGAAERMAKMAEEKTTLESAYSLTCLGGLPVSGLYACKAHIFDWLPASGGSPSLAMVCFRDDLGWYAQALEIVEETCDWVLAQKEPKKFWLHWSS